MSFWVFPHAINVLDGKRVLVHLLERLHNLSEREFVTDKKFGMIELLDYVLPVQIGVKILHGEHERVEVPGIRVVFVNVFHPVGIVHEQFVLHITLCSDHHGKNPGYNNWIESVGDVLRAGTYVHQRVAAFFLA